MQGGLLLVLGVCSYSPGAHVLRICEWLFLASSWAGLWSFFVPEKTIKVEKVFFIWDRSGGVSGYSKCWRSWTWLGV